MQEIVDRKEEDVTDIDPYLLQKQMLNIIPQLSFQGFRIHGHAMYPFLQGPYLFKIVIYYGQEIMKSVVYLYNQQMRGYEFDAKNSTGSGVGRFQPADVEPYARSYLGF